MSAMKHHLDEIVARALATGEPIPDDVADALDDILDTRGLDPDWILDIYGEEHPWALALAQHRRHKLAEYDARQRRRAARERRRFLLIVAALVVLALSHVVTAMWPGTIFSTLALAVMVAIAALLIYRSIR